MKVEAKETSASTYTISIQLPVKQVTEKFQQMFRDVARQVNVPGFRQGKVPRRLLEAQLGQGFLDEDVQNALMEEAIPEALAQLSLRPLSRPETRVIDFAEGKDFSFEVDIEVLPKIEFPAFADIQVEAEPKPTLSEEDVDRILDDLKVRHATLLPKPEGEGAALEDVAVIELEDGEPREILLAQGSELSEQLVGHQVGETLSVTVESQPFSLTLTALKVLEKPDLQELAQTLNKDGEDDLIAEVKSQLQEQQDHEYLQRTRYKVLDAIIEKADVPVPPRLQEEVIEQELTMLQRSGRVGALDDDDRTSYAEGAEQRLQREVALESLKRQHEDLKLSDENFDKIIEAEAAERDMNPVKFKAVLEREGTLQRFRSQKEDERILDSLVEQVTLIKPKTKTSADKAKAKSTSKAKTDK